MRLHRACFSLLFLSIISLGVYASARYRVSLKPVALEKGERVVGFTVQVKSGFIAAIPELPFGWSVEINNEASFNATMTAVLEVASVALDGEFFKHFLVIEVADPVEREGYSPLQVTVELVTSRDFAKEYRHIKIGASGLILEGAQ